MRTYELNDMVKADCKDCAGCSACCQGMGNSIILDPYDVWRLTGHFGKRFEELLADCVELHVEDGIILPNLRMTQADRCPFLNEEGRCRIHAYRPGLCRTFPLGRNYEDGKLTYFLLEGACPKENKTKVKVSKWIDTPDLKKNQTFLTKWHYLLKDLRAMFTRNEQLQKQANMLLLNLFYIKPYDMDIDFYSQFKERLQEMIASNLFLCKPQ